MTIFEKKIEKYDITFDEIGLDKSRIIRILGYDRGKEPEPIPGIIEKLLETAAEKCACCGGFSFCDKIETIGTRSIIVDGTGFNTGKIVAPRLRKADHAAFFICTIGNEIDEYINNATDNNLLLEGYLMDVIASELVESAMDRLMDILEQNMAEKGLSITNRYSPGYCKWDVSEQRKLFRFFPDNFCSITLTDMSFMRPVKSVSGIIGIGKDVEKQEYICNECDIEDCIYRERY